jgi:hypothetical protein
MKNSSVEAKAVKVVEVRMTITTCSTPTAAITE